MASQETGKQRASRIPLDYYKKPDKLARWKIGLTLTALILTGLYMGSGFLLAKRAEVRYSPGPIHNVHQAWEQNCEVCHVTFQPIKQDTWLATWFAKPLAADTRCKNCHAGPPHHDSQHSQEVASCGSCHRDHRGRDVSLVSLPDSDCTSCHRDLKNHNHPTKEKAPYMDVSVFSLKGHPEFALLREDKLDRKLKFNHDLHLRPGQTLTEGGKPWTLGQIKDESERNRYSGAQKDPRNKAPVQLTCVSCHQLDSLEGMSSGATSRGPSTSGAYMLPVTYDNHCKACHPLTFDAKKPDHVIPHHLQPNEVHAFLWGSLAEEKIKDPDLRKRLTGTLPIPGKQLREEEEKTRQDIDTTTAQREAFLFKDMVEVKERYIYSGKTTCGECHHYQGLANGSRPTKIAPTRVPDVWLKHAKFSHVAHRAVDCQECHAKASSDPAANRPGSKKNEEVRIPGIATCVTCHAPASTVNGQARGGVRFNCTECHRYHSGDHAAKGLGASERDALQRRSAAALLSGGLDRRETVPPEGKNQQ